MDSGDIFEKLTALVEAQKPKKKTRAKRNLTDEQKEICRQRLVAAREKRKEKLAARKGSNEPPKMEAKKEPIEAPQVVSPKVEVPKVETPKVVAPKVEVPKVETPKVVAPKVDTPKVVQPKDDKYDALQKEIALLRAMNKKPETVVYERWDSF